MKKIKIFYWITTILFLGMMFLSSIPDIFIIPDTVKFMTNLGYPVYLIPFIGVAKLLGVIAIIIPGFPKIKEWAYAGLMFDLFGAIFSVSYVGGIANAVPIFLFVALGFGSYFFYHKKLKDALSN